MMNSVIDGVRGIRNDLSGSAELVTSRRRPTRIGNEVPINVEPTIYLVRGRQS